MIKQKEYNPIRVDIDYLKTTIIINQKPDLIIIEREYLQQLIDELIEIQNQTLNKILDK